MNNFIWSDLSTYKPIESISFYSQLFNWEFKNDSNYYLGGTNGNLDIGIYQTPPFFQKINMPHFWMNYIQVKNIEDIVHRASLLNGKIEIKNEPFFGGKISLIRDTMGAGFTTYEGTQLIQNKTINQSSINSRELHSSDATKSIEFYSRLFNWEFRPQNNTHYSISESNGKPVGKLLELDNHIKGKYEYWITTFNVHNYPVIKQKLKLLKGKIISDEGNRILVTDKFEEAFFYITSV